MTSDPSVNYDLNEARDGTGQITKSATPKVNQMKLWETSERERERVQNKKVTDKERKSD